MFGEPFRGGVDPEVRMAFFGFVGDAVIHQDGYANAFRLRKDLHQMPENVKSEEAIQSDHRVTWVTWVAWVIGLLGCLGYWVRTLNTKTQQTQ